MKINHAILNQSKVTVSRMTILISSILHFSCSIKRILPINSHQTFLLLLTITIGNQIHLKDAIL